MIIFGDLETTGNDVSSDQILEVAFVVTDDYLNVFETKEVVVRPITCLPLSKYVATLDPVVQKMHADTGLWQDVEEKGMRRHEAEDQLCKWLEFLTKFEQPPYTLAGNSVWFDYVIIRREMPKLAALLDRRVIDVSSINQVARRWHRQVFDARPRAKGVKHRALVDAHESRDVLDYYQNNGLFPRGRYEGW